ncbi:toxin-antitoxin system HicB family antitoxin [Aquipuribacter hungaricus]|uniref:Toxin-antitoxin system HicB family antitoxin n=1 Tax=Aquipuribacter hungaricus TaxID=545624 RepID=A0ABV7WHN6_9MICO
MELSPFVDSLRHDLAAAAGAVGGGSRADGAPDEVRAAAERLLFALDPSVRLVLLDALGQAAAEVGAQLDDAAVEVRLRGREPELVVLRTDPAWSGPPGGAPPVPPQFPVPPAAPVLPVPPVPPVPPEPPVEDDGTARLTLRLPESLKARAEAAAGASGLSVNAWLVRAVSGALDERPAEPAAPSRHPGRRLTGWAR